VCNGVIYRGLSDRAWSKLLISVWWQGWEWVELHLYSPHMPSWHGQGQHHLSM
jgi:hypothetical protein